ncbi:MULTISPECIES: aspartate carbamoyltransferase [unclassified Granulicatella]|uniref:aspartate carbamoyltransferase n=1 Tax=unclassified Granulicatella TaxID=2630493 RepID=UPI0010740FC3|nr:MULTISPECIES: aspartate carbamoyltransferase [unclassified Granulicatella]MBF0780993.1 aspartate carbamoyltransferase [Granulicatella sp. 19428wC4_WM01]TFU92724.1 aspartate carbamoyltransferase [Granulicatella sp. WM01]
MARRSIKHFQHFISIDNVSSEDIQQFIQRALSYKKGDSYHFLEPKFMANLFFDKSTRNKYSVEMAQKRLGVKTVDIELEHVNSLYDTALTLSALDVDALVIRTKEEQDFSRLVEQPNIHCSIINAGNGMGQNPIQTMADLMTIYEEFQRFEGLKVGVIGDVKHSRSAHSNIRALVRLGAKILFSGPKELLVEECPLFGNHVTINELLEEVDVVMIYRSQFNEDNTYKTEQYFDQYGLTKERAKMMKPHAIIMHSGPIERETDLDSQLIESEQSRIIIQLKNTIYMNMAILEAVLA